jgi:cobalt/nickel transport system ATP-binding protein
VKRVAHTDSPPAAVLVLDPEVLLLDEPTASLDPRSETMILELLTSFGSDKTMVTATHDLKLAADLADHCYRHASGLIHSHPHNHVHEHL